MNEYLINLADIIYDSVVDGPNIRTTIFVQGCKHNCPGCHNASIQGAGGYFTEPELLAEKVLGCSYGDTVNVTLSGGEPLLQVNALKKFVQSLHDITELPINIWCYTGFTWEQIVQDKDMYDFVSRFCDVVVDGRFVQKYYSPDLLFKGSSNQRIIDVNKTVGSGAIVLWKE